MLSVLLAALLLPSLARADDGAITIPRNLEQLTGRAAHILRGHVASAHVEMHPELPGVHMVVVTLRVKETLKGPAVRDYTFRQYAWDVRSRTGETSYRKGDELILFLIEPSRYGLSSPAGMGQGRFLVTRDAAGRELATNGAANARLFDGMREAQARKEIAYSAASARLVGTHRQGPIEAAQLTRLVREIVDARR